MAGWIQSKQPIMHVYSIDLTVGIAEATVATAAALAPATTPSALTPNIRFIKTENHKTQK